MSQWGVWCGGGSVKIGIGFGGISGKFPPIIPGSIDEGIVKPDRLDEAVEASASVVSQLATDRELLEAWFYMSFSLLESGRGEEAIGMWKVLEPLSVEMLAVVPSGWLMISSKEMVQKEDGMLREYWKGGQFGKKMARVA